MDSQASVSSPPLRSPERWLAFLRIAIGLWFVKALFTKLSVILLWGFLPVPSASDRWIHLMPILVAKYAEATTPVPSVTATSSATASRPDRSSS